jgi:hypothetical protein
MNFFFTLKIFWGFNFQFIFYMVTLAVHYIPTLSIMATFLVHHSYLAIFLFIIQQLSSDPG